MQYQHKFLAPIAADKIGFARLPSHQAGNLDQELVAHLVPIGIVDIFEVVDI